MIKTAIVCTVAVWLIVLYVAFIVDKRIEKLKKGNDGKKM